MQKQFLMISDNLKLVNSRIESIQSDQDVQLIAVSKTRSVLEIQEAFNAGQIHFGENYLQESLEKVSYFNKSVLVWISIAPFQSIKLLLFCKTPP